MHEEAIAEYDASRRAKVGAGTKGA
jgi:hypothetical protein